MGFLSSILGDSDSFKATAQNNTFQAVNPTAQLQQQQYAQALQQAIGAQGNLVTPAQQATTAGLGTLTSANAALGSDAATLQAEANGTGGPNLGQTALTQGLGQIQNQTAGSIASIQGMDPAMQARLIAEQQSGNLQNTNQQAASLQQQLQLQAQQQYASALQAQQQGGATAAQTGSGIITAGQNANTQGETAQNQQVSSNALTTQGQQEQAVLANQQAAEQAQSINAGVAQQNAQSSSALTGGIFGAAAKGATMGLGAKGGYAEALHKRHPRAREEYLKNAFTARKMADGGQIPSLLPVPGAPPPSNAPNPYAPLTEGWDQVDQYLKKKHAQQAADNQANNYGTPLTDNPEDSNSTLPQGPEAPVSTQGDDSVPASPDAPVAAARGGEIVARPKQDGLVRLVSAIIQAGNTEDQTPDERLARQEFSPAEPKGWAAGGRVPAAMNTEDEHEDELLGRQEFGIRGYAAGGKAPKAPPMKLGVDLTDAARLDEASRKEGDLRRKEQIEQQRQQAVNNGGSQPEGSPPIPAGYYAGGFGMNQPDPRGNFAQALQRPPVAPGASQAQSAGALIAQSMGQPVQSPVEGTRQLGETAGLAVQPPTNVTQRQGQGQVRPPGFDQGGTMPPPSGFSGQWDQSQQTPPARSFVAGGHVPGKAPIPGRRNTEKNDVVPAMLSPGEIVLPRSVTQAEDAPEKAHAFVAGLKGHKPTKTKGGGKGYGRVVRAQAEHNRRKAALAASR